MQWCMPFLGAGAVEEMFSLRFSFYCLMFLVFFGFSINVNIGLQMNMIENMVAMRTVSLKAQGALPIMTLYHADLSCLLPLAF